MRLTLRRPSPACFLLVVLLTVAGPAYARGESPVPAPHQAHPASTAERLSLYAPRVRRSMVMYLRLRLLELREEGLDRARAAIERRLSIDDLLAQPEIPRRPRAQPVRPPNPPAPPTRQ